MGSCWSFPVTCQGQQVVWARRSPRDGEEGEPAGRPSRLRSPSPKAWLSPFSFPTHRLRVEQLQKVACFSVSAWERVARSVLAEEYSRKFSERSRKPRRKRQSRALEARWSSRKECGGCADGRGQQVAPTPGLGPSGLGILGPELAYAFPGNCQHRGPQLAPAE